MRSSEGKSRKGNVGQSSSSSADAELCHDTFRDGTGDGVTEVTGVAYGDSKYEDVGEEAPEDVGEETAERARSS